MVTLRKLISRAFHDDSEEEDGRKKQLTVKRPYESDAAVRADSVNMERVRRLLLAYTN